MGSGDNHWPPNDLVPELWVLVRQDEVLKSNLIAQVLSKADSLGLVDVDSAEQGFELAALEVDAAVD